jgi:hypothetical protein
MDSLPQWITAAVVVTDLLLVALVLLGVGRAARRAGFAPGLRRRLQAAVAAAFAVWLGAAVAVSTMGLHPLHPAVLSLIGGPVVVGYGLYLRSETWRSLVRAAPQAWLVGGQFYRVIGALFLVVWGLGELPAFFAIPAGVGDVVTGVAALVVAAAVVRRVAGWRRAVVGWNAVGLADLVVAVGAGSTLLAGPLSAVFAAETTTLAIVAFPLGLIPMFLVPTSVLLHLYSLSNLAATPAGAAADADAEAASRRSRPDSS